MATEEYTLDPCVIMKHINEKYTVVLCKRLIIDTKDTLWIYVVVQ